MTNKVLRRNQVLRGPEDDLPETNFTREQDKASAGETLTRLVTGGHAYPSLPETSPWSVPVDHGFHPDRDRVDEPTSMVTGIDMTTLSGAPPPDEDSLSHQAPVGEVAADGLSATSPTFSKEEE